MAAAKCCDAGGEVAGTGAKIQSAPNYTLFPYFGLRLNTILLSAAFITIMMVQQLNCAVS